jgi:hypothetical protein
MIIATLATNHKNCPLKNTSSKEQFIRSLNLPRKEALASRASADSGWENDE